MLLTLGAGPSRPSREATVREATLENGLTVLAVEARTAPVVSVWTFYRAGSRNERPGRTGLSHLVEHATFRGAEGLPPAEWTGVFERHAGSWNGYTWLDETAYVATVPKDLLDLALKGEALRMSKAAFAAADVETERNTVLAELDGTDASAAERLDQEVVAAAFKAHPYSQPAVGWKADLQRATRESVREHWAATHLPANATVVMVGDFAAADALAAAKKHFEAIPRGEPAPLQATAEPAQEGERRVSLTRVGDARRLQVSWKAPAVTDPDFTALLVADAILGGAKGTNLWSTSDRAASRSSRLHKRLLVSGLAREASSRLHPTADPFLLSVRVAMVDGADSTRAEQAVVDAAESLGREVPAKELDRAKAALAARLVFESASPTDLAHQLALFETLDPGGAGWRTALRLPDAVAAVTAADVKRAAAKWLAPGNRTVGWFVPSSRAPREASLEGPARYATHAAVLAAPAKGAATPPPLGPKVTRTVLSNGLVVLSVRNPIAPEVSVRIDVKAGSALEAPEKAGLASLTARLAASGSAAKDEAAIAAALEAGGATLETSAGVERVTLRARMLAADAPAVLAALREVVASPAFPKDAFDREKALAVAEARAREDEPGAVAEATLRATLYPPTDPRSRHPGGRPDTILALGRADAGEFHRQTWRPERTVIVVSGDLDPAEAAREVKKAFGSWRGAGAAVKKTDLAVVPPPPAMWIGRVHLDGPGPTEVALGWPLTISRAHADWPALAVLDAALSGRGGRLASTLRDERTWTTLDGAGEMPGPFLVRTRAEPKRADDAVETLRAVLSRLAQEGLAAEDLAAAKDRASGELSRRFESNPLICDFFADVEHARLGIDYARRLSAQVQSLTVEDVNRAARDHIRTDGAAVTAGPKK